MQDIHSHLRRIRRPRLLISAARFALAAYDREIVLRSLLGAEDTPPPGAILARLVELETDLDARRRAGDASYPISRHIEALAAIMAESRSLSLVA